MTERNLDKDFQELLMTVLKSLKSELENIEDFPVDFNSDSLHDTIHKEVDSWAACLDRKTAISWIDFCGNEDNIDEGVVDRSSLEKTLITMTFECVKQHLFDKCQLLYDMQEYDLTKKKRNAFVKEINKIIGDFEPKRIDSESQIWIELKFPLSFVDFPPSGFNPKQMIDLHDGIKILASNVSINRNAIVIEKPNDEGLTRIYLMDRDKDIDIREFFKKEMSIAENNYSLLASDYVNGGKVQKKFDDKKKFIWFINQMVCNLLKRN
jgi:hypothetical protein